MNWMIDQTYGIASSESLVDDTYFPILRCKRISWTPNGHTNQSF